jgi:acetyltransferase-like isoleucine patch superfamily enzyme
MGCAIPAGAEAMSGPSAFSREPVEFALPPDVELLSKFRWFFGHYDLRVFVRPEAYIDVGRGSFDAVARLSQTSLDSTGCLGTVGQFCDFSTTSEIFCGGEHNNDQPVNVVFTNVKPLALAAHNAKIASLRPAKGEPFSIGNAVVISANATILAGAKIGDGAVVAAGAVVPNIVEDFTISGGVPARKIKDRVDEATKAAIKSVRWWDFDLVYLGNALPNLQELAVQTDTEHHYRKEAPRIVLTMEIKNSGAIDAKILGFLHNGDMIKPSDLPPRILSYFQQMGGPGPYKWIADIWDYL